MLRAHAEQLNPGRVRFNHELTALTQDDDGVLDEGKKSDVGWDTQKNIKWADVTTVVTGPVPTPPPGYTVPTST